jgi:hypothetical protein
MLARILMYAALQGKAKVMVEVSAVSGQGFFSKGKVVLHTLAYVSIRQHTSAYRASSAKAR